MDDNEKVELSWTITVALVICLLILLNALNKYYFKSDIYSTHDCICRDGYRCEPMIFSSDICVFKDSSLNEVDLRQDLCAELSNNFSLMLNQSAERIYDQEQDLKQCVGINYNLSVLIDEEIREQERINSQRIQFTKDDEVVRNSVVTRESSGTSFKICYGCDYYLYCTGSMHPVINCFSTEWLYKASKDDLRAGDIIAFESEDPQFAEFTFILHRIVEVKGDSYYTKGDANYFRDEYPVSYDKIIGKVYKIEYEEAKEVVMP